MPPGPSERGDAPAFAWRRERAGSGAGPAPQLLPGLRGELAEALRLHAPGKAVVERGSGMRRAREIVVRRDPETFLHEGIVRERLLLRNEALQQCPLVRLLIRREIVNSLRQIARRGQKAAGLDAEIAGVIEPALDRLRRAVSLRGAHGNGMVNGKSAGVVIGVAALVSVNENCGWSYLAKQLR